MEQILDEIARPRNANDQSVNVMNKTFGKYLTGDQEGDVKSNKKVSFKTKDGTEFNSIMESSIATLAPIRVETSGEDNFFLVEQRLSCFVSAYRYPF